MSETYRAYVDRAYAFSRDTVRLKVAVGRGYGRVSFLNSDGTWTEHDEGTAPADMGIELPAGAIEAIAAAIEEYQGHASHADTEARVLREWLVVERGRVDRTLEARP
jgi:hypothetical protein